MPLQTTATTDIPFNLDGTIDRATWGESGGPFSVPAEEGPGLGAAVLASNTVNYEWQHPARHIRGIEDRFVKSDDGLFTSCVVRQGAWNDGAGTLNITLGPTRLVVDFAQDGGLVLELFAVAGSPEVLGASEDAYVDITDAGVVTVVAVPNNDPEPPLTASSVRFYKLVTDATELTSATLVDGVAPFPCLGPTVGIAAAQVTDMTIGGTLDVSGLTTCEDLTVNGNTILGDAPADTVTVTATMTVTPVLNATAGIQGAPGALVLLPEGATVLTGKTLTMSGTAALVGGVGSVPSFEVYELQSEKAASSDRQLHHLDGHPRWNEGGDDDYMHRGTEPWSPVGSVPALDTAGPTSAEIDGPTAEVTLTGTAFIFVSAAGTFTGNAADTEAGIRVEVDGVDVYDQSFPVFNTERALVWSTCFTVQEGAGTFDVKIKIRRSAGSGSVSLAQGAIFAMPT